MTIEIALHDNSSKQIPLNSAVFDRPNNPTLVHQLVVAYEAAGRAGTKAQKSRAEVRGGGIKPWRQKGTGRARAGSINSPIWRTGGKTFAAKPRDYAQKVNKKMYRAAMQVILSELRRQDRLLIVDELAVSEPKTKQFFAMLATKKVDFAPKKVYERLLLVSTEVNDDLTRAARNVPNVAFMTARQLDPVSLISAHKILITTAAIQQLEELLA